MRVGVLPSDRRRLRTEKHLLPLALFRLLLLDDHLLLATCGLGAEFLEDVLDVELAGGQWLADRVFALLVRGGPSSGHFRLKLVCG